MQAIHCFVFHMLIPLLLHMCRKSPYFSLLLYLNPSFYCLSPAALQPLFHILQWCSAYASESFESILIIKIAFCFKF